VSDLAITKQSHKNHTSITSIVTTPCTSQAANQTLIYLRRSSLIIHSDSPHSTILSPRGRVGLDLPLNQLHSVWPTRRGAQFTYRQEVPLGGPLSRPSITLLGNLGSGTTLRGNPANAAMLSRRPHTSLCGRRSRTVSPLLGFMVLKGTPGNEVCTKTVDPALALAAPAASPNP